MNPGPLAGVVVLDLTRVLAGPYCTMMLAELGARVIKVEIPGCGDDSRHFDPYLDDVSGYFMSLNRGKESIALNLKDPADKAVLLDMAAKGDVIVENYRCGTLERLGLGFDQLKARNPRLIYASVSGFGHTGPWRLKPAYDMIVQALGGLMSVTGQPGSPPTKAGTSVGDITGGLFTLAGVLSALYHRAQTGVGMKVDVSMLDGQIAILESAVMRYLVKGTTPGPMGNRHPSIAPFASFETADRPIIIAVGNDLLFRKLCETLGRTDMINDPRFRTNRDRNGNVDAMDEELQKVLRLHSAAEWIERLDEAGVPCSLINTVADAVNLPQVQARNMVVQAGKVRVAGNPIKFDAFADPTTRKPAPLLDEHGPALRAEFAGPSQDDGLLAKAAKYLPGGCLGMMALPDELGMVMVRGHGSKIYDSTGREYLDYMLGSGPLLLGHARPEVVAAVQKQAALGSTFFALSEPAILLAERLVEAAPCGEMLRYQSTGTEATFSAMRLARAATGREKILKFEGGWHGGHDVGQLSGNPAKPPAFPLALPDCDGIPASSTASVLVAPFNDIAATAEIIETHHRDIACVIVEPLQRVLKPEPGFLEALRTLTRRFGIVLIFDEIVTGFRIAWGGAQERYGVLPDLACYGKAIAGGYPLSAIVGRRDLMELADPTRKGRNKYCFLSGTLSGNPLACAAGLAALDVLSQKGVYERLHAVSDRLMTGIRQAGRDAGVPLQVLGDGPVMQVYFVDEQPMRNHRDLLRADRGKATRFGLELIRRGVYCAPGGKLYLSLAHSEADVDRTIEIAAEALKAV